jgi:hypothetical protein
VRILFFSILMALSQFAHSEVPAKAQYRAKVEFLKCASSGDSCVYILHVPEVAVDRQLTQGTGDFPYDSNFFDGPTLDKNNYIHADVTSIVAYDVGEKKYEVSATMQVRDYQYSAPFQKHSFGLIKTPSMKALNETTLATYFEYEGEKYKVELSLKAL